MFKSGGFSGENLNAFSQVSAKTRQERLCGCSIEEAFKDKKFHFPLDGFRARHRRPISRHSLVSRGLVAFQRVLRLFFKVTTSRKRPKSFEGDRRTLTTLISCPAFNTWAEETLRQEQPSFVRLLKTSPRLPLRNSKALYSLYGGECPIRGPGFLAAELCVACVNSPCDGIFKASAILRWHSDIPLHCRRAVFKGKRLAILAGRPLYIESLRSLKVLIVRRQMWQAEPKKNRKRFPPRAPSPRFTPYGVEWECLRLFFFFFSRCRHL